jgi:hypothetical protein
MNAYDKNNLKFIMSLTDDQFDDWMDTIDYDEFEYAVRLIRQSRQELLEQEVELELSQDKMSLKDANQVLSRFVGKK